MFSKNQNISDIIEQYTNSLQTVLCDEFLIIIGFFKGLQSSVCLIFTFVGNESTAIKSMQNIGYQQGVKFIISMTLLISVN